MVRWLWECPTADAIPDLRPRRSSHSSSPSYPLSPPQSGDQDGPCGEKADDPSDGERRQQSEPPRRRGTARPAAFGGHPDDRVPERRQPSPSGGDAIQSTSHQTAPQRGGDGWSSAPSGRRPASRSQAKPAQSTRTVTRQSKKCVVGCRIANRWRNSKLSGSDLNDSFRPAVKQDARVQARSSEKIVDNTPRLKRKGQKVREVLSDRDRRERHKRTSECLVSPSTHGIIVTVTGPTPSVSQTTSRTASGESLDAEKAWVALPRTSCILPEDLHGIFARSPAEEKGQRAKVVPNKLKLGRYSQPIRNAPLALNQISSPLSPSSPRHSVSHSRPLKFIRRPSSSLKPRSRCSSCLSNLKASRNPSPRKGTSSGRESRTARPDSFVTSAQTVAPFCSSCVPHQTRRGALVERHPVSEIRSPVRMDSARRFPNTSQYESRFYPYLNGPSSTKLISPSFAYRQGVNHSQYTVRRHKMKGKKLPCREIRMAVQQSTQKRASDSRRLLRQCHNRRPASISNLSDLVLSIPGRPYLPRKLFRSQSFPALRRAPREQSPSTQNKEILRQFSVVDNRAVALYRPH